ncbi:uncharacterized protein LOC119829166 [Zerene cesonia]|uniref:uncharacterized protein LOC119829166 n=1 Tax=Zerene cesonia TaxID=33412 RepID=UPI0018E59399|nr:uncharacterized protein LOC119829166 [Zerene cesonia]
MQYIPEDRLNDILSEVARKINLKRWRYTCQNSMDAIENYFGVLVPATIHSSKNMNTSEDDIKLHLLIKITPNNIEGRLKQVFSYLFEAEVFFYTALRPMFSELSAVSIDGLIPNCYHTELEPDKQVIVLQDMTFEGYRRYTAHRFLDFEHLVVALKTLAKFHAVSVIVVEKGNVSDSNNVIAPYTDEYPVELNTALKLALKNHCRYFSGTKYETYLQGLISRYSSACLDSFKKARRLICGHGDYWKENILFKYKENKPDRACIVDFQTVRFLSPSQDFLSFILVSTDKTTRSTHYDELMSTYIAAVTDILIVSNDNLAKSFIDDFKQDLKVVAENCLITSFMGFALWYGLEEDTLLQSKNTTDKNILKFTETIGNAIDDLERLGYITIDNKEQSVFD